MLNFNKVFDWKFWKKDPYWSGKRDKMLEERAKNVNILDNSGALNEKNKAKTDEN